MAVNRAVDRTVEAGIDLVHPSKAHEFYDLMHSYLASVGVTGPKIDVFQTIESVSEEHRGRVELAKAYYDGLNQLMTFGGKTHMVTHKEYIGLQGLHMIHCSYNSFWMGQMIQPDWDMFQSDHVCAVPSHVSR